MLSLTLSQVSHASSKDDFEIKHPDLKIKNATLSQHNKTHITGRIYIDSKIKSKFKIIPILNNNQTVIMKKINKSLNYGSNNINFKFNIEDLKESTYTLSLIIEKDYLLLKKINLTKIHLDERYYNLTPVNVEKTIYFNKTLGKHYIKTNKNIKDKNVNTIIENKNTHIISETDNTIEDKKILFPERIKPKEYLFKELIMKKENQTQIFKLNFYQRENTDEIDKIDIKNSDSKTNIEFTYNMNNTLNLSTEIYFKTDKGLFIYSGNTSKFKKGMNTKTITITNNFFERISFYPSMVLNSIILKQNNKKLLSKNFNKEFTLSFPPRDIEILNLTYNNQTKIINITIKNNFNKDIIGFNVKIFDQNLNTIEENIVDIIKGNKTKNLIFKNHENITKLYAYLDSDNHIYEVDEMNNAWPKIKKKEKKLEYDNTILDKEIEKEKSNYNKKNTGGGGGGEATKNNVIREKPLPKTKIDMHQPSNIKKIKTLPNPTENKTEKIVEKNLSKNITKNPINTTIKLEDDFNFDTKNITEKDIEKNNNMTSTSILQKVIGIIGILLMSLIYV